MTKRLIQTFIKDWERTSDPAVREAYGKLAGMVGILTNLFLATAKVMVGMMFSSIAIITDGVNNLSDAGSSIVTLVGFKLAGIPEDAGHPYGHARYEYIAGLIISIVIIILGLQFLKESVLKILYPEPVNFSFLSVGILLLAVLVKLWQMFFYKYVGEAIQSSTVKAVSKDSRNDMISTAAVLLSLLIGKWLGIQLDGIMGAMVAVLILYSGIDLVRETIDPLLGKAPDRNLVEGIETKIMSYDGVLGIHDLVVHEYGPGKIFASAHVEVDAEQDVMKSHDLVDNIERDIVSEFHIHFVIHMDPVVTRDEKANRIKGEMAEILKGIHPSINFHDFRYVPGYSHTNLIFDVVVPINFHIKEDALKEEIQRRVSEAHPTYFTVITVDKDYTISEGF